MKKGFTLIELLVVIAIIALLSSIVLASLNDARTKARDSQRIASLIQTRNALENYFNTNGEYPGPLTGAEWNVDGTANWNGWGHQILYNGIVGGSYISSLPKDPSPLATGCTNYMSLGPSNCRGEIYFTTSDKQCYVLGTNLEKTSSSNNHPGSWCGNYQIVGGNCSGCVSINPTSPN